MYIVSVTIKGKSGIEIEANGIFEKKLIIQSS